MAYTALEARKELLDSVAAAANELGTSLALLGDAFELLDEATADALESKLFAPVQAAFGRLKRTHAESARAHDLPAANFEPQAGGLPSAGAKGLIDAAVEAAMRADVALAAAQDSPKLIELGDSELRAGLTEARALLGPLRANARELERTLGR